MVCAGGGDTDTCGGDSGGPLMVSDGAFLVLTGLTSWGADPCASRASRASTPGSGIPPSTPGCASACRWRGRRLRRRARSRRGGHVLRDHHACEHPRLHDLRLGLRSDGSPMPPATRVTHAYPDDAHVVAGVRASGAGVDAATDKLALTVGDPTTTRRLTSTPTPTATPSPTPGTSSPAPRPDTSAPQPYPFRSSPRAVRWPRSSSRPSRVSGGRWAIRVRFATAAPARTAVIEVIRNRRVIGIARTKVLRGGAGSRGCASS